jgi:hypothetical protein
VCVCAAFVSLGKTEMELWCTVLIALCVTGCLHCYIFFQTKALGPAETQHTHAGACTGAWRPLRHHSDR